VGAEAEAAVNRIPYAKIAEPDGATVESRVIEICRAVLEDPTITAESTPATVECWDSLGHMDLIAAIEATFAVELDIEQMADVDSVRALVDVVKGAVNACKE
jgi:acyl carrier protein